MFKQNKFQIVKATPVSLSHMEGRKVVVEEGVIEESVYKVKGRKLNAEAYHRVASLVINDALEGFEDAKVAGIPLTRDQVIETVSRSNLYAEVWVESQWLPVGGSAVRISDLIQESNTNQPVIDWPQVLGGHS